jgi:cytochrome c2
MLASPETLGGSRVKQHLAALAVAAAFAQPATDAAAQDNLVVIGELVFFACQPCHLVGDAKLVKPGPHLNDLFGRRPGSLPDYEYSEAMVEFGQNHVWDETTLSAFLKDTASAVPGTKMNLAGIKKDEELRAVIAYLATFDPDGMDVE